MIVRQCLGLLHLFDWDFFFFFFSNLVTDGGETGTEVLFFVRGGHSDESGYAIRLRAIIRRAGLRCVVGVGIII